MLSSGQTGVRWGVGVLVALVAAISFLVISSYRGHVGDHMGASAGASAAPDGAPDPATTPPQPPSGSPDPAAAADDANGQAEEAAAPAVPAAGSGDVRVARFTREGPADQSGRIIRIRVEVENEMPTDPDQAALEIANVLHDSRSWMAKQRVRFDFVGEGDHDLVVRILTPGTTDLRCQPLDTGGEVSCYNWRAVNLNGVRWETGVPHFEGDLHGYRTYLVNHEVGHHLGLGHLPCPGPGELAPVMMQQTKGLDGCQANPWP